MLVLSPSLVAFEQVQKSIAFAESFVPLVLLLGQGADDPFELAVFASGVALYSAPNALMLYAEETGRPSLTRVMRWVNFGVDAASAAGLLGFGVAYLAGAFGPGPDTRSRGGAYLALSIPAGIAAFADFFPYSVEHEESTPPESRE